ncbi:hypothetical protein SteCoe_24964 [Stentor coeruleus]|uniref:Protein kinase domain-containing protein n=1 Tax=Stentor coeruleus TaxID=5963 RepID=A0A1R2BGH1_9CILI|nr:hypothetical protein SteCoe_24964 [Stentor coeruleus]
MSGFHLLNLMNQELRSKVVEDVAQQMVDNGYKTDVPTLEYFADSQISDIKIYALANMLLRAELEDVKLPENISLLEKSLSLLQKLPNFKETILYHLDTAVSKNISEATSEEDFIRLAKIIKQIRDNDPNLTTGLISGSIRLRAGFTMKYTCEIQNFKDGDIIIQALTFLNSISELGFEIDNAKYIMINPILSFVEYRNKIISISIEAGQNVQQDYKILNLASKLNFDEDVKERMMIIRKKLEEIEPEVIEKPRKFSFSGQDHNDKFKMKKQLFSVDLKLFDGNLIYENEYAWFARTTDSFQVSIYRAKCGEIPVAVKIYKPLKDDVNMDKILNEMKCYQLLGDKANVTKNCFLKYYGSFFQDKCSCLVMEYLENDLMKFLTGLKKQNFVFSENHLIPLIYKLLISFAEMEELGIYHGDIKPHNMLIDKDWNMKIIDYSISVITHEQLSGGTTSGMHPLQGTVGYMAPEIAEVIDQGMKIGNFKMSRADVFSLGMVFLQMLTLKQYDNYNKKQNSEKLMAEVASLEWEWAQHMLGLMLNSDPELRPKFRQLLQYIPGASTETTSNY